MSWLSELEDLLGRFEKRLAALEAHLGLGQNTAQQPSQSQPAPAPAGPAVTPATASAPKDGQAAATAAYMASGSGQVPVAGVDTTPVSNSGFDLHPGGAVTVNPVEAGKPYTYQFVTNLSVQRLTIMGAPGGFFRNATVAFDGGTPSTYSYAGSLPEITISTALGLGHHTVTISVDGSGPLGVQYHEP